MALKNCPSSTKRFCNHIMCLLMSTNQKVFEITSVKCIKNWDQTKYWGIQPLEYWISIFADTSSLSLFTDQWQVSLQTLNEWGLELETWHVGFTCRRLHFSGHHWPTAVCPRGSVMVSSRLVDKQRALTEGSGPMSVIIHHWPQYLPVMTLFP